MKIFFYINALYGGGAERVMSNLATQFANAGHDVGLITTFRVENEYAVDEKVARFALETEGHASNVLLRNLERITGLRRILKEQSPDVLISFLREPNFRAILAAAGLKTKVIVSVRNDPVKEYSSQAAQFLARNLFRKADGVVFQTPDAQGWFPDAVRRRSTVIANQVNPRFFDRELEPKRENIVTVGRLSDQKNHRILLKAFAQVKDEVRDDLVIYGEGELRQALETEAERLGLTGRVHFPGNITDVDLKLAKAKAFVLSSDYEGMPNALMEAMAMGLPCISTDCPCGGPKMLIENGENGILIPVGDAGALAEALRTVLKDDANASRLGQNAKRKAEQFRPERIFKQWESYAQHISMQ